MGRIEIQVRANGYDPVWVDAAVTSLVTKTFNNDDY